MQPNYFSYHPIKGLKVKRDKTLDWVDAGPIADKQTLENTRGAGGLYAFVLMPDHAENRPAVLYVGKAGGLKPKKIHRWANDIRTRAAQHWGTGPFRGLAIMLNRRINLWIINIRAVIDQVGERDIERIENELLRFLDQNHKMPPGNTAIEGGKRRHFRVQFKFAPDDPLPRIILQPGECEDNRKRDRDVHKIIKSKDGFDEW